MQDIREIELRDSGSNANNKIFFEVRASLYVPALHTEGFSIYIYTGSSTKGPSPRNYNFKLGVYYSLNHNHLHTRGIRHKAKQQSPLYKRDKHKAKQQSQSSTTITSTQEG